MTSPSLTRQPLPLSPAHESDMSFRRLLAPVGLFLVTLCSTTAVGMRYMYNFQLGRPPITDDADILPYLWVWHNLHQLTLGLPFSLTLISILLAHEFGHYFACRYFKVDATLPYMLPAPSLSGTFGAVIRLRARVPSRAALICIGAAGPIAGFMVAIAGVWAGLAHSTYALVPVTQHIQAPLLMAMLQELQHAPSPLPLIVPHPVLSASWIGLLITSLNLIPAGQLDGGHIVYAFSPRAHRITSRVTTAVLLVIGVLYWVGWILWALVLLLPNMRHPRVPAVGPLKLWQRALLPICIVILLFSGMYRPFQGYALRDMPAKFAHRYSLHRGGVNSPRP